MYPCLRSAPPNAKKSSLQKATSDPKGIHIRIVEEIPKFSHKSKQRSLSSPCINGIDPDEVMSGARDEPLGLVSDYSMSVSNNKGRLSLQAYSTGMSVKSMVGMILVVLALLVALLKNT